MMYQSDQSGDCLDTDFFVKFRITGSMNIPLVAYSFYRYEHGTFMSCVMLSSLIIHSLRLHHLIPVSSPMIFARGRLIVCGYCYRKALLHISHEFGNFEVLQCT